MNHQSPWLQEKFITTKDKSMTITKIPITIAQWMERLNVPSLVSTLGLCTIMFWIGAFKFTPTESRQIMVYVGHSPLMSWMYHVFSIQTTSDIIGIIEMIAATGILLGTLRPFIGLLGSLLSVVIFTVTSTFMLSTPGMIAMADGMWHTSPMGSFVIKDVTLLGASLFLAVHYGRRSAAERYAFSPTS
jgi:reactive chlorine resistance protein C